MRMVNLVTLQPAHQLIVPFSGVSEFFGAMTTIRTQYIDIQFLFSGVDTDIMKFMFHRETNLANTDYRENRSMILSGLSLWEKGSPLHKSTQQVENLRPDTACGLQAEKTGRFSLHRRDNTRPDKRSASGSFLFIISLRSD
ncbi:hypothetical protein ERJG_02515 [Escherichia coli M863]|nr:hypothetical protein ERJG_02515 [Escherichia coli M863]